MKHLISLLILGVGASLLNFSTAIAIPKQDSKPQILHAQLPPEEPSTREQPLLPPRTKPLTTIKVINQRVSVRLVNQTGEVISYIAIGDTPERRLNQNSNVLLRNLNLPASINCYYRNKKVFIQKSMEAKLNPDNSKGILEVILTSAPSDVDSSSIAITIGRQGGVRLN
ncbi:hypothetical protein [Iningainema tapete]|uniref:AMIN domain-containing protein n=1 Tax=Iningainema tapete BLCC-T55 TaxID=2748662 RepID=A0A8J6XMX2_9CYAN|nr:hypothetical protein [Iningainema tapete]MBD2776127.1 hypothetical protein [Iningainema tapete BLCC-T55]